MKLPFCSEGIRPLQRSMVAHIEKLKNRSVVCTADSAAVLDCCVSAIINFQPSK